MMLLAVFVFLSLFLVSLIAGVFFGLWWGISPASKTFTGPVFTEVHQKIDRTFGKQMPYLFVPALVSILISIVVAKDFQSLAFWLRAVSFLLVLVMVVSTLLVNVPINRLINSWDIQSPPANWQEKRDRWERFHSFRTFLGILALALQIMAVLV